MHNLNANQNTGGSLRSSMQADACEIPVRCFQEIRRTISIGEQACAEARKHLQELMSRLSIASPYGNSAGSETDAQSMGEIEDTNRQLNEFVDLCRELRGLAETLEARL